MVSWRRWLASVRSGIRRPSGSGEEIPTAASEGAAREPDAVFTVTITRNGRTVVARQSVPGESRAEAMAATMHLAELLAEQDPESAIQVYEQVLEARTADLGPAHPDTLLTLEHLAHLLRSAGLLAQATERSCCSRRVTTRRHAAGSPRLSRASPGTSARTRPRRSRRGSTSPSAPPRPETSRRPIAGTGRCSTRAVPNLATTIPTPSRRGRAWPRFAPPRGNAGSDAPAAGGPARCRGLGTPCGAPVLHKGRVNHLPTGAREPGSAPVAG